LRTGLEFFKTTAIGGLVAIVPLTILGVLAVTVVPIVMDVADVLEQFLPFGAITNLLIALVGGVLVLVLICFLAGVALLTGPGDALRQRLDSLLGRIIPLYGAARKLTERVTGTAGEDFVPVAVDLHRTGAVVLGLLVENVPGDRCAVFVPMAPAVGMGNVFLVDREQVELVEAPMSEVFGVISEWGVGSARVFRDERRSWLV
jgi:uncharacterized membrane protein